MKDSILIGGVALVILAAVSAVSAGQIATSTFDAGNEDWMLVTTLNNTAPTTWQATGGNPGGYAMG